MSIFSKFQEIESGVLAKINAFNGELQSILSANEEHLSTLNFIIKLFRSMGYTRLLLFFILSAPTSGRHLRYYGWLSRMIIISLGALTIFISAPLAKYHYAAAIVIFYIYRLYQRYKYIQQQKLRGREIKSIDGLTDYCFHGHTHKILDHYYTVRDGVTLHYQTIGVGKKLIFISNGLGGKLLFFMPLITQLEQRNLFEEFQIVSWDYRGLFSSSSPPNPARLSVRDHAEDCIELMRSLQIQKIHTFIGWSTGVQVGLELASRFPKEIDRLILLNGSHGHTLQAVFQPLFRVPWLGNIYHDFLTVMRTKTPFLQQILASLAFRFQNIIKMGYRPYSLAYNNPDGEWFNLQYVLDICGNSRDHTENYLRIFQELDAHSVQHLLDSIETPAFIITGALDVLTPAYQSFEMADKMPNSTIDCYTLGTHFAILEFPTEIGSRMVSYILKDGNRLRKVKLGAYGCDAIGPMANSINISNSTFSQRTVSQAALKSNSL